MLRLFKILLVLYYVIPGHIIAQNKQDYIWISGAKDSLGVFYFNKIDFHKNQVEFSLFKAPEIDQLITHNNSVVSSPNKGGLQFFTNGCMIAGLDNKPVIKKWDNVDWDCYGGYPIIAGSLLLPCPSDTNRCYFINLRYNENYSFITKLKSTELKTNTDGSQSIESENKTIVEDSLSNTLMACKHANGRDWWIIVHKQGGNKFFRCLLTPEGVSGYESQEIGLKYPPNSRLNNYFMYEGQSCFSPDGKHFATYYSAYGARIYDFDRCTGLLSNPKKVEIVLDSADRGGGIAFSENSRFLYYFAVTSAYQLDMESSDMENSAVFLDTFDGFESPFKASFLQPRLAPDGKIYMGCTNGNNVWHVVNHPNEKGKACDFVQHGIHLPTYSGCPPNVPYYRLGRQEGSPCDTLGIGIKELTGCEWKIYPNPADVRLKIALCGYGKARLTLTDIMGRQVYEYKSIGEESEINIDTRAFPEGIYLLHDRISDKAYKIAIQR